LGWEPTGIVIVNNPEVAKLFGDETRRRILHLLTHGEMSPADIVKETGKNFSSIVYHLDLLEKAGLIATTRTEVIQNKIQPYYRAKAWSFHVSYNLDETLSGDEEYRVWQDDLTRRLLEGLSAYGVTIHKEQKQKAKELIRTLYILEKREYEEQLSARVRDLGLEPHVGKTLSHMLSHMRLKADPEYAATADELYKILRAANPKL
jgi:DNA-binding transcriptional ArsR family regulator